ncbi:MAG: putative selenate ABC transporter substrate-binding protein [Acidimicrobiales bacterium]
MRFVLVAAFLGAFATLAAACGDDSTTNTAASLASTAIGSSTPTASVPVTRTLKISAIPDQDPQKLAAREGAMATYLSTKLGVKVEYVPVSDYAASVTLFKTGDLDLVFYGGLTGVQARLQTPGATLIAQRDIDDAFRTVFIANAAAAIAPITDVKGLTAYKGKRFTFGSESSTSGRMMPEYFLDQAGVSSERDFAGAPGYSGSHDKTIDLVQSGTFDGGALNVSVWNSRKKAGTVDTTKVVEIFTTPSYRDYHWIAGPKTDERFGAGFTDKIRAAILGLDYTNADQAKVLDGYAAKKFMETKAENYKEIESIGRKLKLING